MKFRMTMEGIEKEYSEDSRKALVSGYAGDWTIIMFEGETPVHGFRSVSFEKADDAAKRWAWEGAVPRGLIRKALNESD